MEKGPHPVPSTSRGRKRSASHDTVRKGGGHCVIIGGKVSRVADEDNPVAAALLDMLECPVCMDLVPVGKSVYSCSNGHIVCDPCYEDIGTVCPECRIGILRICPTCRDERLTVNKYVQRLAAKTLENVSVKCVYADRGCGRRHPMSAAGAHEESCNYRDVPCVGKNCNWWGALDKLLPHNYESHCFDVRTWDEDGAGKYSYSSAISRGRGEVGGQMPLLLVAYSSAPLRNSPGSFVFFFVKCNGVGGDWCLSVRAVTDEARAAKVTIEVTKAEYDDGTSRKHTYTGDICPVSADEKDSIKMDRAALVVKDEEVRALARGDRLFKYKITLVLPDMSDV